MGYNNPYSVYKETGVMTASQGKLIIMLYDEAVRQLTKAISLFNDNGKIAPQSIEKLNANIVKTQEILTELMVSLDMEKGGEIAKNLMALYVFFNKELLEANISCNKDRIKFILDKMTELNSAWNIAVESTAPVAVPPERKNIDING